MRSNREIPYIFFVGTIPFYTLPASTVYDGARDFYQYNLVIPLRGSHR